MNPKKILSFNAYIICDAVFVMYFMVHMRHIKRLSVFYLRRLVDTAYQSESIKLLVPCCPVLHNVTVRESSIFINDDK